MVCPIIREMPGFRVASFYGRGCRQSTNGGFGTECVEPGKLALGDTWKQRDNSRFVGYSEVIQKRAWRRSKAISAKPTPGERDHFRIADHAFSAGRTD